MRGETARGNHDLGARGTALALGASVLAAAVLQFLLYRDRFLALSIDDSYRTLDAWLWRHDRAAVSEVWLPGHRALVGAALGALPDLLLTPRLVSAFLGIASIVAAGWMTHELFESRRAAAFAAVIAAAFPARIALGGLPLADMLFIALMLFAVACMTRWLRTGGTAPFLWSTLFCAAASAVRYEGWIWAALFAALGARRAGGPQRDSVPGRDRVPPAAFATAAVALAAFPLYWIIAHRGSAGGPLGFVSAAPEHYGENHATNAGALLHYNPLTQLVELASASMVLVGIVPLAAALRSDRRMREWAFPAGVSLGLVSLGALAGRALPTHDFWRIPALWGMLLVPFAARWVELTGRDLLARPLAGRALLLALIVIPSLLEAREMTRRSAIPPGDLGLGRQLERLLAPPPAGLHAPHVLIDNGARDFIHIVIVSQHPEAFIYTEPIGSARRPVALVDAAVAADPAALAARDIRFVAAHAGSPLLASRGTAGFLHRGEFGAWALLEVVAP